ncbi:MAG: hypothetical protein JW816_01790 [Candidatus Buchananbacteria bacterium]|nr:hypothetical protein [Candidatus Buchananbacteria bacterium]
MKKSYYAVAAVLGLIITTGIVAATSLAADSNVSQFNRGPRFDSQAHQSILQALENRDYQAWKEAVGNNPIANVITQDNFDQYAEMHDLMQAGKIDEAKAIADQLGIKNGFGMMGGRGYGLQIDSVKQQAIQQALDNKDYTAWKAAVGDNKLTQAITEDNFDQYMQMHDLIKQGREKFDQAQTIARTLGLNGLGREAGGRGMGMMMGYR